MTRETVTALVVCLATGTVAVAVAWEKGYAAAVEVEYRKCLEQPGWNPATCEGLVCAHHGEKYRGRFR